jgi:hypothetical protein
VDAKYYVRVVVDSIGIVGDSEGVFCLERLGGRYPSGSGTLLLGRSLRWNRNRLCLCLRRHGGVVIVVVGGGVDVFGGVGVVCGGVVCAALLADNLFVVANFVL